jgi:hypothetical protein
MLKMQVDLTITHVKEHVNLSDRMAIVEAALKRDEALRLIRTIALEIEHDMKMEAFAMIDQRYAATTCSCGRCSNSWI